TTPIYLCALFLSRYRPPRVPHSFPTRRSSDLVRADGSVLDQATWTIAQTGAEAQAMGFMAVHLDTLGWSLLMGLVFILLFRSVAKSATEGVPGKLQNLVEITVEFIEGIVKDTFHGRNPV